jgi:hypothetical protein
VISALVDKVCEDLPRRSRQEGRNAAREGPAGDEVLPQEEKMLVVEFIGASGVGKSTVISGVRDLLAARGVRVCAAEDLILTSYGLPQVRPGKLRVAIAHLLSLRHLISFFCTSSGFRLCCLGLRAIVRDAGGLRIGLSLARNFLKRIGFHFWLEDQRERLDSVDVILCDEGVVHAAHNLFVHAGAEPNAEEIAEFARLVPKPSLLIWVTAPTARCVGVHLARGHSRVEANETAVQAFAERAHATFEMLASLEGIKEHVCRVENAGPNAGNEPGGPAAQAAADFILQACQQARLDVPATSAERRSDCPSTS